jgi:RND family efflux transporter MFP subunit
MPASQDLSQQLRTLTIPRQQRPQEKPRRGRSFFGTLFLSVFMLAAGVAGAWAWQQYGGRLPEQLAPASEVALVTVKQRSAGPQVGPVLTATGKIVSDHRVEVQTKVSGQIVALYFEQGDRVKKDQILARIEDVNYRALRDQASAMLAKSNAELSYHTFNLARIRDMYKDTQAARIELQEAERAASTAQSQVAADQAGLDYAEKSLHDTEILAPIAGVILERNVEVGDFVAAEGGRGANANAQFASIADMNALRVEVDISEMDIARVRTGMHCTVTPDAYKDRKYDGRVLWIDPGANYAKATVQAKVRIEQPDDYLRVEGAAQVIFLTDAPASAAASAPGGLWIPEAACIPDTSGTHARVFVAENGHLTSTLISVGPNSAGEVQVLDGLREGQRIAAKDLQQLHDGQKIRH